MKAVIVGCGLSGITSALLLKEKGYEVEIFDTRNHVGGNCYDKKIENVMVHQYGPHGFHTNNEKVWKCMTNAFKILAVRRDENKYLSNFYINP